MAGLENDSQAEITLTETKPGVFTVRLAGELDIQSAEGLGQAIDDLVGGAATQIALDLSALEFMDSSGLALLLRLSNRFGPLPIHGANLLIRRVIEVTGLTGILQLEGEAT